MLVKSVTPQYDITPKRKMETWNFSQHTWSITVFYKHFVVCSQSKVTHTEIQILAMCYNCQVMSKRSLHRFNHPVLVMLMMLLCSYKQVVWRKNWINVHIFSCAVLFSSSSLMPQCALRLGCWVLNGYLVGGNYSNSDGAVMKMMHLMFRSWAIYVLQQNSWGRAAECSTVT